MFDEQRSELGVHLSIIEIDLGENEVLELLVVLLLVLLSEISVLLDTSRYASVTRKSTSANFKEAERWFRLQVGL